ncbi:MAG: zf-HC2 domain-containing protein [Candidatus Krumholzibacteria bacterium]|nr:zf-HC2 domain-containing protein [Candidatus Krumholzibacteria bacterium]
MDCMEYRKSASRVLDGEADAAEERELMLHLEGCGSCRLFHESLQAVSAMHRELVETTPPPGILDAVLATTRRPERISGWWKIGISAAAAVVILLGVRIGDYISSSYGDASSPDQAEVFEMDYLEAFPPGSLGERLMVTMEGDVDV